MKTKFHLLPFLIFVVCHATALQGQIISTIAGNGTSGYTGTGGPATAAELFHPKGTATDDSGNVYIADADNNMIRKISLTGTITTICGYLAGGFSGDGGLAIYAGLSRPNSIAIDRTGNIYICDADNQRIRKIDTAGIIHTLVGDGTGGYIGDGGHAATAEINEPGAIAVDKYGNLYIADELNNVIRKVDTAGIITSFAGNGATGFSGEGGPATAATIGFPFGVACDTAGNVFFSLTYEDRICKVDPAGIMTTYAGVGGGAGGFAGDGGPATAASIDNPWGIGTDLTGNVYIADFANERIRKVDLAGNITTFAGNGGTGFSGDGSAAVGAKLRDPAGVSADATGNVYIADYNNHRIRKVSIANHAPYFVSGASQSITVCEDTAMFSINSTLVVVDSDNAQLETWSQVTAPVHGTLTASYGTFSTGSTLTPAGLSYIPNTGYTGHDSFKISVSDNIAADTITVYVTDTNCASTTSVAMQNNGTSMMTIFPNPGNGVFELSIAAPLDESAHVVITDLVGKKVSEFITTTNKQIALDIEAPSGIYLIEATSAHNHWSNKLVITGK